MAIPAEPLRLDYHFDEPAASFPAKFGTNAKLQAFPSNGASAPELSSRFPIKAAKCLCLQTPGQQQSQKLH
ncbi:MAG: hypothetical protein ROR55_07655 [Devosia sp.]